MRGPHRCERRRARRRRRPARAPARPAALWLQLSRVSQAPPAEGSSCRIPSRPMPGGSDSAPASSSGPCAASCACAAGPDLTCGVPRYCRTPPAWARDGAAAGQRAAHWSRAGSCRSGGRPRGRGGWRRSSGSMAWSIWKVTWDSMENQDLLPGYADSHRGIRSPDGSTPSTSMLPDESPISQDAEGYGSLGCRGRELELRCICGCRGGSVPLSPSGRMGIRPEGASGYPGARGQQRAHPVAKQSHCRGA